MCTPARRMGSRQIALAPPVKQGCCSRGLASTEMRPGRTPDRHYPTVRIPCRWAVPVSASSPAEFLVQLRRAGRKSLTILDWCLRLGCKATNAFGRIASRGNSILRRRCERNDGVKRERGSPKTRSGIANSLDHPRFVLHREGKQGRGLQGG